MNIDQLAAILIPMKMGATISFHDTGKGVVYRCRIFDSGTDIYKASGKSRLSSTQAIEAALEQLRAYHEEK